MMLFLADILDLLEVGSVFLCYIKWCLLCVFWQPFVIPLAYSGCKANKQTDRGQDVVTMCGFILKDEGQSWF